MADDDDYDYVDIEQEDTPALSPTEQETEEADESEKDDAEEDGPRLAFPAGEYTGERANSIRRNLDDVRYRNMINAQEWFEDKQIIPHSGQVYMYHKRELLPNFYYYKQRFMARARAFMGAAGKSIAGGRLSTKNSIPSRKNSDGSTDRGTAFFMHSAEHLREYYNGHIIPVFGFTDSIEPVSRNELDNISDIQEPPYGNPYFEAVEPRKTYEGVEEEEYVPWSKYWDNETPSEKVKWDDYWDNLTPAQRNKYLRDQEQVRRRASAAEESKRPRLVSIFQNNAEPEHRKSSGAPRGQSSRQPSDATEDEKDASSNKRSKVKVKVKKRVKRDSDGVDFSTT